MVDFRFNLCRLIIIIIIIIIIKSKNFKNVEKKGRKDEKTFWFEIWMCYKI